MAFRPDFPTLEARDLDGRQLHLPRDLGVPALVLLAFQHRQHSQVVLWKTLAEQGGLPCPVWEAILFSEGFSPARGFIDGGMRAGVSDASMRSSTLVCYTDVRAVADALGLPSLDRVHALLLDKAGRLRWWADGPPGDRAMECLQAALEELG